MEFLTKEEKKSHQKRYLQEEREEGNVSYCSYKRSQTKHALLCKYKYAF